MISGYLVDDIETIGFFLLILSFIYTGFSIAKKPTQMFFRRLLISLAYGALLSLSAPVYIAPIYHGIFHISNVTNEQEVSNIALAALGGAIFGYLISYMQFPSWVRSRPDYYSKLFITHVMTVIFLWFIEINLLSISSHEPILQTIVISGLIALGIGAANYLRFFALEFQEHHFVIIIIVCGVLSAVIGYYFKPFLGLLGIKIVY